MTSFIKISFVLCIVTVSRGHGFFGGRQLPLNPTPSYRIPTVRMEPLSPKGLRVSIADEVGIELYAFHGSINAPITGFDFGGLSADVHRPLNRRWTYYNGDVALKPGDIIYYWIFVQKNGVGYRKDNQRYVVGELIESGTGFTIQQAREIPLDPLTNSRSRTLDNVSRTEYNKLLSELNATRTQLSLFINKIQPMANEIRVLREVMGSMAENAIENGTNLVLKSSAVNSPTADHLTYVRAVLTEKLQLIDLCSNIHSADFDPQENGIVFEVGSVFDKHLILARAKSLLDSSQFKIFEIKKTRLVDVDANSSREQRSDDGDPTGKIDVRMTAGEAVATKLV